MDNANEGVAEVVSTDIAADESVEFEPTIDPSGVAEANETDTAVDGAESEVEGPRYTVTVDGETIEVTEAELLNGYQRQADYTRKTQALASERENLATLRALEQALTADPQAAVAALAQAYGLQFGADTQLDTSDMDPLELKVSELERTIQRQQEAARLAAIESEASQAITTHGLSETGPQELIRFAMENQIGNLGTAALLMQVQRERAEAKKVTVAKVTESKRKAAVVEGGKSRGDTATQPTRPKNIREAFAQAMSQLST